MIFKMKRYLGYYKFFLILLFLSFTFLCSVFLLLPQQTSVQSEIPAKDVIINEINDYKYFPFDKENLIVEYRDHFVDQEYQEELLLIELKKKTNIENILIDKNTNYKSELFIDTMANSFYFEDGILFFKFTLFIDTDINLINFAYTNLLKTGIKKFKEKIMNRISIINDSNKEINFIIDSLDNQAYILNRKIITLEDLRENKRISENFYYENYFVLDGDISFIKQKISILKNKVLINNRIISNLSSSIDSHNFNPEDYPTLSTYSFEKKSVVLFYVLLLSVIASILLILLYDLTKRDFKT
tara:strand:- start:780 stop:1679 length:900 start_codon:yes stop_codon:yes gene_type:complete